MSTKSTDTTFTTGHGGSENSPGEAAFSSADHAAGEADLLARARDLAERVLLPRANQVDQSDVPPADNIHCLASAGLLGLSTPQEYGGHGASGATLRAYSEILASACGVTTFVQGQHQSCCSLLAGSSNEALKAELLPKLASGELLGGVAFSHLRRPGTPTMRVERDGDGYVFNGVAPWMSGYGLMNVVVLGGTLPDSGLLYTVVPLTGDDALQATPAMHLCAMNASGTVALHCTDYRVPLDRELKIITMAQMSANDLGGILGVTPQTLGVTTAALRLLNELAATRHSDLIAETANTLLDEQNAVRQSVEKWRVRSSAPDYKDNALQVRAWCIDLGVRAAHAAVIASGGGANSRDHTAQRLYREAMFYTLTAQTRDVQTASLQRVLEESRSRTQK